MLEKKHIDLIERKYRSTKRAKKIAEKKQTVISKPAYYDHIFLKQDEKLEWHMAPLYKQPHHRLIDSDLVITVNQVGEFDVVKSRLPLPPKPISRDNLIIHYPGIERFLP